MDDICTACLCTGRKLYFIGESGHYHLYYQILNEISVYDFSDVCVRVCWECCALLRRFDDFKELVKRSYSELLQHVHQNIPPSKSSLIRPPHLEIQHVFNFSYPKYQVKEEIETDYNEEIDNGMEIQQVVDEICAETEEIHAEIEIEDVKVEEISVEDVKVEVEVNNDDGRTKKSKNKKVVKEKSKKPEIKVKIKKNKRPLKTKKAKKDLWLPTTTEGSDDDDSCDSNDEIGDGEMENEERLNTDENNEIDVPEKEDSAEKIKMAKRKSREEVLERKRVARREKYKQLKANPERYFIEQQKKREAYLKRKSEKKVKSIKDMSPREQKVQRRRWKENSKRYLEKKYKEREINEINIDDSQDKFFYIL